jgi:hypothetical protein
MTAQDDLPRRKRRGIQKPGRKTSRGEPQGTDPTRLNHIGVMSCCNVAVTELERAEKRFCVVI